MGISRNNAVNRTVNKKILTRLFILLKGSEVCLEKTDQGFVIRGVRLIIKKQIGYIGIVFSRKALPDKLPAPSR